MGEVERGGARTFTGRFELTEKVGNGYLGPVFRAIDRSSCQTVAVRLIGGVRELDHGEKSLVLAGCRTLATIHHPSLVPVLEAGEDRGLLYVVTEYVEGHTLEPLAAGSSATLEQKLSLLIQAAEGLAHAHRNGVLHCDFRPSKACITAPGVLRIRDLGLSRMLPRYQSRPIVKWGKPIYLSPEQIEGSPCTPASDIFSAGVVFQEFLTGVHPFQGEDSHRTLDRILKESPRACEELLPDAPRAIGKLLRGCLEKDPGARLGTMDEVAEGCRQILREMADDARVMLSDLLDSLRLLRAAARSDTAPPALRRLRDDVERLAVPGAPVGYSALEDLTTRLFEFYPLLQDACCGELAGELDEPAPPAEAPSAPPPQDPVPPPALVFPPDAAPVAPVPQAQPCPELPAAAPPRRVAPETPQVTELPAPLPPSGVAPQPAPEPVPRLAPAAHTAPPPAAVPPPAATPIPEVRPLSRRARLILTSRRMRPSLSRAAGLLAVLLTLVAAYIFRNAGSHGNGWPFGGSGRAEASAGPPGPAGTDVGELGKTTAASRALDDELRTEVLVREAQELSLSGRDAESRAFLQRALEISPGNETAQTLLGLMKRSDPVEPQPPADPAFSKALSAAGTLLDSGNLTAARTAIDRLQRQFPGQPEVRALRRRWDTRNARTLNEEVRREEEKREAARNRERLEEGWAGRIQSQIADGRYPEARGAISLWLSQDSANVTARNLAERIDEAEKAIRSCEEALGGKRYQDALTALATVERLSPSHPQAGELRRRAELGRANARGSLTVYRLGLRGTVQLDGRPIGSGDEVENEAVPAGPHSLSVRGEGGTNLSARVELSDGQKAVFVYDLKSQSLRPLTEGDRERLNQRRAQEEIHRFALEHSHGLFRGSCRGELLVGLEQVEFRPLEGTHHFQFPFRHLELRIDSRSISLFDSVAERELCSFRIADQTRVAQLRKTWDRLQTMARQQAAAAGPATSK